MYSNVDENLLSVASSLFEGKGFFDTTVIPNQPIANTHMGLAFLELLLLKVGFQNISDVYILTGTIHYISFLLCVVLLYQMVQYFKLSATLTLLIVGNFIFSSNIFLAMIAPLNDGIGLTLAILGIFLVMRNSDKPDWKNSLLIFLASVIGVHFKIQYVTFMPLCGTLASLIIKQYKNAAFYLFTSIFSVLSVYIPYKYFIGDNSLIFAPYHRIATPWPTLAILFLKFGEMGGRGIIEHTISFFYLIGAFIVYYCLKYAWLREFKAMLIALIILSNIAVFSALRWHAYQHMMLIVPLFLIVLGATFKRKALLQVFLLVYMLYGMCILSYRMVFMDMSFLEQKKQTEQIMPLFKEDVTLISQNPRASYKIFHKPSQTGITSPNDKNAIILFGNDEFLDQKISMIRAKTPNVKIVNYGTHWKIIGQPYALAKVTQINGGS
jgi:hypothetical protein